jgi:hypothetical protein
MKFTDNGDNGFAGYIQNTKPAFKVQTNPMFNQRPSPVVDINQLAENQDLFGLNSW